MTEIRLTNLYDGCKKPIVLGLGFFDCVHLGHKKLLDNILQSAKIAEAESAVFTFSTAPNSEKRNGKQIYTFSERVCCMQNLGIENVIYAEFNDKLKNLEGEKFLDILNENFNISKIIAGKDFTYGKNALCGIKELTAELKKRNIEFEAVDFFMHDGKKLSTSEIRVLIENGEIEKANALLSEPYFMLSTVRAQKGRGRTFGVPTANIKLDANRVMPAQGVYATTVEFDKKRFKCVTNVGVKPTFSDEDFAVESHILDFCGDIYGKQIKLIFWRKLRDDMRFNGVDELKTQIQSDIKSRLELEY